MSNRLRFGILAIVVLFVANVAWRVWASWGLITINVTDVPASEVIRSIEKQAGIRLRSNLPADKRVTIHVEKAPLLHALDVLAANTETSWRVSYLTASDKQTIENALGTFSNGQELEGWKRISLPPLRGMDEFEQGSSDPRQEEWESKPASEGTLQAYLEQVSHTASAQFLVPEQWNPSVSSAPKSGKVKDVIAKLAKAAHGQSAEVFLLQGRPQRTPEMTENRERREGGSRDRNPFAGRGEEIRKVMEERMLAQIAKLPADKKSEAMAELEERKKFFEEMSQLSPDERRARIQERMEQEMNNSAKVDRMEANMAKRGAMQTAEQRSERYRGYIERKNQNN